MQLRCRYSFQECALREKDILSQRRRKPRETRKEEIPKERGRESESDKKGNRENEEKKRLKRMQKRRKEVPEEDQHHDGRDNLPEEIHGEEQRLHRDRLHLHKHTKYI